MMNNIIKISEEKKYNTEKSNNITNNQNDEIVELMMDRGMLPDNSIEDESLRIKKQKLRKNAYHNTMLLLKRYRIISWMLECFPGDVAIELDRPFENIDKLIEAVDVDTSWGNKKLESRMKTIEKTRLLMDRLNEALTVLKKKPEDGERLYKIIYLTYISPEKLSHNELLFRLDLSTRHYYRLRNEAVSIISVRLWSATTADVDVWMNMIARIDELS